MDRLNKLKLDKYTLDRIERGSKALKEIDKMELVLGATSENYVTWTADEILYNYPAIEPYCRRISEHYGDQLLVKYTDLPLLSLVIGCIIEIAFLPDNDWVARIQDEYIKPKY